MEKDKKKTVKEKTEAVYPLLGLRVSKEFKKKLEKRSLTYGMTPSEYIRMLVIFSFDTDSQTMRNMKSRFGQMREVRKPK